MGCERNVLVNIRIISSGRKISSSGLKKNLLSMTIVTLMLLTSFSGMLGISVDSVSAAGTDIGTEDTDISAEEEVRYRDTSNQETEDEKASEEPMTKTNIESETATASTSEPALMSSANEDIVANNNIDNIYNKNVFSDKTSDIPDGVSEKGWDSITSQIREAQYYPTWHETSECYVVSNPEQDLNIEFDDGNAILKSSLNDEWSWSLIPFSYGYEGHVYNLNINPQVIVDGNRIEYLYDEDITGWYVNGEDGLEHGFDIARPPQPRTNTLLNIEMHLDTSLAPNMINDGEGIVFLDSTGKSVLNYGKLLVTDATGRNIPSYLSMSADSDSIIISIDDTSAIYPIIVDPLVTSFVKKLTASDGAASDFFGYSVSISCDTLVVGAYGDDSSKGAAYVFTRNNQTADDWGQVKKLTASDGANYDSFGYSVSISCDTLVVGAYRDSSYKGAAYVFTRNNQTADDWGQVKKLTASDGSDGDYFGRSVSISCDTLVVGAYKDDSSKGAAYVFTRNNQTADDWGQVKKLTASDGSDGDYFGRSVSISCDTLVVGAYGDDSSKGAAYVFTRNNQTADDWGQVKKLTASDGAASDFFGYSVSISCDTLVVGAYKDDSSRGSAYIYIREGNTWTQQSKPVASDGAANDNFGCSVSIYGDTLVVGSQYDDSGSAYVFTRNHGGADNWGQVAKLTASDGQYFDNFGYSVSICGDMIVVGAIRDDDFGTDSGAAYVFTCNNQTADDWGQVAKLTASDGAEGDWFGYSVSICGDMIVVGSKYDDDKGSASGAAYVFTRNNQTADDWGRVKKLTASDGSDGDYFGCSVSISCDTLVVGAYGKESGRGAAYVFTRNNQTADDWGQVAKIISSDAAIYDYFGYSVSISGDMIVVGEFGDGSFNGAAYVFTRNNQSADDWGQVTKLTASDGAASDRFGYSVSISGDTIVVGANQDDDSGTDSGSSYVFTRNNQSADDWGQVTKLTASDGVANNYFGGSVSICCNVIVVGAYGNSSSNGSSYVFCEDQSTGVDPPTNFNAATNSSSEIYLTWTTVSGADKTCIQRKTGSYPTDVTDGTNVCNTTESTKSDTSLTEGTTYYYRAWSWNNTDSAWSTANASATSTTNNIPTIATPGPANQSTNIDPTPQMNITINDADGNNMTLTWYSNTSGSYVAFGTNTSCSNNTYHQTNNNFSDYNTKYWWYVTVNDGSNTNTSATYHFTTRIGTPTVTTNTSTGVEENNATLHGYLTSGGGESCTVRFEYGTDTSYGTNTSNQTKSGGQEFSAESSLTAGQLYHYRAYANNTVGSGTGSDMTLLTKPQAPTGLTVQTNSSSIIYLTWTKGTGANNTYIERNTTANWARGTGTTQYNGSLTHYEDTGPNEGTTYYYQAWSYTTWSGLHQYSDTNNSASNTTNNIPTIATPGPANQSTNIQTTPQMNITINDADGNNMTLTWYSNSSGSWAVFGTNTTCTNNTYHQTNSNFTDKSTTYYWNVTVSDGTDTNTSDTYHFTVANSNPSLSGVSPTNGSTGISRQPTLQVTCTDANNENMNVTWKSNSEGTWATFATNTSISTGTIIKQTNSNFSSYSTTYYWSVNVTDGTSWTNATYHFKTKSKGGGGNGGTTPPVIPPADNETTDNETTNTKENEVENLFNATLDQNFSANDTNGDGILELDDFEDPNGVLNAERLVNISGNPTYLMSVNGSEDNLCLWDTQTDTITQVTYQQGNITSTTTNTENDAITITISVNKSDWIYIEVTDIYPDNPDLTVKTSDGRVISSDMFFRENNKVYILDDPDTEYDLIYGFKILQPTFNPTSGTTVNTSKPTISIKYDEIMTIISATLNGEPINITSEIIAVISANKHMFSYTPETNLTNGEYIFSITVQDTENNSRTDTATYTVNAEPKETAPAGVPWIIMIIAMITAIALIIAILIKTGNLHLGGKPPKKRKK